MSRRTVDADLRTLAGALDPELGRRLVQLIDASPDVHELIDLRSELQRSEDLVKEMRRQLDSLLRQNERLRAQT